MSPAEAKVKNMSRDEIKNKIKQHFNVDIDNELEMSKLAKDHNVTTSFWQPIGKSRKMWVAMRLWELNANLETDDFYSDFKEIAIASVILIHFIGLYEI